MEIRPFSLPVGPQRIIRAALGVPRTATMDAILVLAHGANNTMDHPLIAGLHERLARSGLVTVRFNFPYAEAGRKRPDPDDALEGVFRLVLEYVGDLDEFKGLDERGPVWPPKSWPRTWGPAAWSSWATPSTPPGSRRNCGTSPSINCPARRCSLRAPAIPSAS